MLINTQNEILKKPVHEWVRNRQKIIHEKTDNNSSKNCLERSKNFRCNNFSAHLNDDSTVSEYFLFVRLLLKILKMFHLFVCLPISGQFFNIQIPLKNIHENFQKFCFLLLNVLNYTLKNGKKAGSCVNFVLSPSNILTPLTYSFHFL